MAEKAVITRLDYIKKVASGDFQIGITATIGYGTESYATLTCVAMSSLLDPVLPTWRTLIRDAVVAAALKQYGLTVDGVLFNDLVVSIV